jgi:hypothetical protein
MINSKTQSMPKGDIENKDFLRLPGQRQFPHKQQHCWFNYPFSQHVSQSSSLGSSSSSHFLLKGWCFRGACRISAPTCMLRTWLCLIFRLNFSLVHYVKIPTRHSLWTSHAVHLDWNLLFHHHLFSPVENNPSTPLSIRLAQESFFPLHALYSSSLQSCQSSHSMISHGNWLQDTLMDTEVPYMKWHSICK